MKSDIFESVHSSDEPFSSLELEVTEASDLTRLASVATEAAKKRGAVPVTVRTAGDVREPPRASRSRHTFHIWWDRSGFWREVHTSPNLDATTIVVTRDTMLMYVSFQETLYLAERVSPGDARDQTVPTIRFQPVEEWVARSPLLNPPLPADDWKFETLGGESYLGRVVRRVRATRRAASEVRRLGEDSGYWFGVDEYECLVDDNLEILLRLAALVDGIPIADLSMSSLRVDEHMPSETFRFSPPPGTKITRTPWMG